MPGEGNKSRSRGAVSRLVLLDVQFSREVRIYRWQNHVYGLYLFHKPA